MPVIVRNNITAHSDIGNVRTHNEDSYTVNPDRWCFAVADGVGGAPHGEVASSIATRCVFQASAMQGLSARDVVWQAFHMAGKRLSDEDGGKFTGMMTTLVVLCFDREKNRVAYGYIGDSRLYARLRGKKRLLTKDHQNPDGSLSAVLGTHISYQPVIVERNVASGDVFVLCTDGVSNEIDKDTIIRVGAQFGAKTVVNKAIEAGGRDNATAIVVRIP